MLCGLVAGCYQPYSERLGVQDRFISSILCLVAPAPRDDVPSTLADWKDRSAEGPLKSLPRMEDAGRKLLAAVRRPPSAVRWLLSAGCRWLPIASADSGGESDSSDADGYFLNSEVRPATHQAPRRCIGRQYDPASAGCCSDTNAHGRGGPDQVRPIPAGGAERT
jgi:hypothetical protein